MLVLNIYGKINKICISEKMKLFIGNLPQEKGNDWNSYLFTELKKAFELYKINCDYLDLPQKVDIKNFHNQRCLDSVLLTTTSDDERLHEVVNNMICLFFDYNYDDMPLGGWGSNPFDGRFCEDDYAELIADFLHFISSDSEESVPTWVFSSNHGVNVEYRRLFFPPMDVNDSIQNLKKLGAKLDLFLESKNDYLELDYLVRALHDDNKYNTFHFFKLYSLCQLFLENESENDFDSKLVQFLDSKYSEDERREIASLLRKMRNKIAHGDFIGFEKKVETYASTILENHYYFDYSEYSRKNWVIVNVCCMLTDTVKKIICVLLTDKLIIEKIKRQK